MSENQTLTSKIPLDDLNPCDIDPRAFPDPDESKTKTRRMD